MTATLIPNHPDDLTAVKAALADYRAATEAHGPSDAWDGSIIDTVIRHLCAQGGNWSANDARDLLPPVRKCLISRRLIAALNAGQIERVGYTRSSLRSTHGAVVSVYRAVES